MNIARILKDDRHQPLKTHLGNVAQGMQAKFANTDLEFIAFATGLLHDLGKYDPKWQEYLVASDRAKKTGGCKVNRPDDLDHWLAGASYFVDNKMSLCALPVYCHHIGLQNRKDCLDRIYWKKQKGYTHTNELELLKQEIPNVLELLDLAQPWDKSIPHEEQAFIIRLIYSLLIDEDRLDAQLFEERKQKEIKVFKPPVYSFLNDIRPSKKIPFSELLPIRKEFGDAVENSANLPPGIYTLTGECGIGKTVASLRFAVKHLELYNKDGIIYIAPLKAIIEQTAKTYIKEFRKQVLVHYGDSVIYKKDEEDYRTSAERWDEPVIVTSTVQFFESIYSAHSSKCRKLANIRNKVLLWDEPQQTPSDELLFCLWAMEMLVKYWGCTVILMSATHPPYKEIGKHYPDLLDGSYYATHTRPLVAEFYSDRQPKISYQQVEQDKFWEAIAESINESKWDTSLTIVNTVKRAKDGYNQLSNLVGGKWVCVTAENCPAERIDIFRTLPKNKQGWTTKPVHVIGTSLFSSGVDLSFPIGNAEVNAIDLLLQLMGRIDRKCELTKGDRATFNIFDDGTNYFHNSSIAYARKSLKLSEGDLEKALKRYYNILAELINSSKDKYVINEQQMNFKEISKDFKLIDDYKIPILLPYKKGAELIEKYWDATPKDLKIEHLREINYYSGMFTEQDVKKMEAEGMVELRVVKRNWDGDVVGGIYFAIA